MNAATLHPDAMTQWAPQRQMTLEQARKRSSMVGFMRMLFVAGAAISAGVMIGPIAASTLSGGSQAVVHIPGDQVVTMVNPRFTGRNIAGETFVITADTARRRRADANIIDLTNPKMVDDKGTEVTAPIGVYFQNSEYLDLFEAVKVIDSEGYTFVTSAARVFVQEGRVQGLEPLSGNGPLGDVRADTYEIVDDGDRVILRGNVDMTIYPSRPAPEDDEDSPAEPEE